MEPEWLKKVKMGSMIFSCWEDIICYILKGKLKEFKKGY